MRAAIALIGRCNAVLGPRGWMGTGELNLDAMRRAVVLAEAGDAAGTDRVLVEYFDRRTIELGLH